MSGFPCASAATAGATIRKNADWKAHSHDAGWAAGSDVRQLRFGRLDAVEQRRGVADEHPPGLGQSYVATSALKQFRSGLPFKHCELLGDRARGVVEGPRGTVDGAPGVDLS